MTNYIVSWNNRGSSQNFLVTAESFTNATEIIWSKFYDGYAEGIYSTSLSIDKNMGINVYYVIMSDESKFLVTTGTWDEAKDWVYQALGTNVNTIMGLGLEYIF